MTGDGQHDDGDRGGLTGLTAAERHREVCRRFSDVVATAATDWDAPTPVAGWSARDVVEHLTTWFPAFLEAGGVAPGRSGGDDPAATWDAQVAAVQALLDDERRAGEPFTHPQAGSHRLADAVDSFYTTDVFLHTWDLARAVGADDDLEDAYCAHLLDGMRPIGDLLRSSGHYGPEVPVPGDATPTERLMGFIGRDPTWTRPARS